VRDGFPDRHSVITFPNFSALNIQTDGTQTLNDINGNPLDPLTGQPLSGSPDQRPIPTPGRRSTDPTTRETRPLTTLFPGGKGNSCVCPYKGKWVLMRVSSGPATVPR
jgi:hypothetical protein